MVRRLTAIMFTDMVGFTAMVQADERAARERRDRQRHVLERVVNAHGGAVLETYGDGTLSVFSSAIEAVAAATAIQARLRTPPEVPLRIGIHIGDIIHDEHGVFGDGVNVAARVQALSVPGGVLVSGKVQDEVSNQPEIRTVPLGAFSLKNVKRPMEVYAVVGEGLRVPEERTLASRREVTCASVAVLPFVNLSPDPENEYFSDGVTDEIINALTRVNGLQVTARTSSFSYKNQNVDVRRIGAELGVGAILEGSVRRAGDRVRITAQLVDTSSGYHLVSEVYDRSLDDIFRTQDEIAQTIVERLAGRLLDASGAPSRPLASAREEGGADRSLVPDHPQDTDAYTEYLKGLHLWRRWSPDAAKRAIRHFERSIELDPECSLPFAGIASAYTFLGSLGQMMPHDVFPRAKEAARKALVLDERSADSHLALAVVKLFYDWDFDAAYRSLQKSLSLAPGAAEPRHIYAHYLAAMGEFDAAVEEAENALSLDPLSLPYHHALASILFTARRYEEAAAQALRALELDPDFRAATETLGLAQLMLGELEEAATTFETIPARTGDDFKVIPHRAYVYERLGRTADVERMTTLLRRRSEAHPTMSLEVDHAVLWTARGDFDRAFDHLERAADQRLGALVFMAQSPIWDDLRGDGRFQQLLGRVGLPTTHSASAA